MSKKTNISIYLIAIVIELMAVNAAFAVQLWPLQVGQKYIYKMSDPSANNWTAQLEIDGQITSNSFNYFHLRAFNYSNDSAYEDWGYGRSTENQVYYSPGNDYIGYQKATVGTKWIFYEAHKGLNYKVNEIVSIEPVTVPYGEFDVAYKTRKYRCVDPNDLSKGKSPDWYEWVVPGVGWVKSEDYWVDGPAPVITELADRYYVSDLNHDYGVGLADFAIFAGQWLKSEPDLSADFNHDGLVNWFDLTIVADNWLQDVAFGDPFVGTRAMTLYGDDNISDGVTIDSSEVTAVTSKSNNTNYTVKILDTTFSMTRDGNDLLVLNPQPQYFATWTAANAYILSDGSNGAFLLMGKDTGPLDISIHVGTWAPPAMVTGSQLAGQWKIKWVYDDNLRSDPFSVETETLSITDLGSGQVNVQFDANNYVMSINGNKLEPVDPIPNVVYFSMVTDGQGIAVTLIGVEPYDPTDVSARIGLASRVP